MRARVLYPFIIILTSISVLFFLFKAPLLSVSPLILQQTQPTLGELKALKSIRGKISGAIVWSSNRTGHWQVYKMKADGTEKIRLTNNSKNCDHPVWSKKGQWIYYQIEKDIFRMKSDGTHTEEVVEDGFSFDLSPDGRKLIYIQEGKNKDTLLIYDLKEKSSEEILPEKNSQFEGKGLRYPTFSPDGEWISFASDYPHAWTVHMIRKDGTGHFQFGRGCQSQYRPDGKGVIWVKGGEHTLYKATPEGKEKAPLFPSLPGRPHCYFPRWSPEGEFIVFAASPHRSRATSDYEIYIFIVESGKTIRLTFHSQTDTWPDIYIP